MQWFYGGRWQKGLGGTIRTPWEAHVAHMGGLRFNSLFFKGLNKSFRGEERYVSA